VLAGPLILETLSTAGAGGIKPLSLRRRIFFLGDVVVRFTGLGDDGDEGGSTLGSTAVRVPSGSGDLDTA
jgi:hypothetical protein